MFERLKAMVKRKNRLKPFIAEAITRHELIKERELVRDIELGAIRQEIKDKRKWVTAYLKGDEAATATTILADIESVVDTAFASNKNRMQQLGAAKKRRNGVHGVKV